MSKHRMSFSAFTLVELLVVMAVIAILASLLAPSLKSAKEQGEHATSINNLKQIGTALQMYLNDHDEVFPPALDYASWRGAVGDPARDIQRMLNDYVGANNGSGTNNMDSRVWVSPTAGKKFGRRVPVGDDPRYLAYGGLTRSWGFHDITYRWNSITTRDSQSMNGSMATRSYPQKASALKQPSKAAIFWEVPDELENYGLAGELHGGKIDCLFVDGHVEPVRSVPGASPPQDTLWWYVGWGSDQGWDGATVPYP